MKRFAIPALLVVLTGTVFLIGLFLGGRTYDAPPALAAAGKPIPVGTPQQDAPVELDKDGHPYVPKSAEAADSPKAEAEAAALRPIYAPVGEPPGSTSTGSDRAKSRSGSSTTARPTTTAGSPGSRPSSAPTTTAGAPDSSAALPSATLGSPPSSTPGSPSSGSTAPESSTTTGSHSSTMASSPSTTATGDGSDDDGEVHTGYYRFTDPCAENAPGEGDCPEGTGGIVLLGNDHLPAAPPLAIEESWMGPHYERGASDRCPMGVDPDGTAHTEVYTNVPATMTLTLDVRGEHHVVHATTSEAERNRFTTRLLAGETIDGSQANGVQTCVTFTSLPRTIDAARPGFYFYKPAISATDDAGSTVAKPVGFLVMRIKDPNDRLQQFPDNRDVPAPPTSGVRFEIGRLLLTHTGAGNTTSRCPTGPTENHDDTGIPYRAMLTSTLPGTFRISVHGNHHNVHLGEFRTSADEKRLNDEFRNAGKAPSIVGTYATQTCIDLGRVFSPGDYRMVVHGTSNDGRTSRTEIPFTLTRAELQAPSTDTWERPPATTGMHNGQFRITETIDHRTENLVYRSLPRNGPDATDQTCSDVEQSALRHRYDPVVRVARPDEIDSTTTENPHSPFDRIVPLVVRPNEGSVLQVCIWIYTKPEGSFDPVVKQRASFTVTQPAHLRYAFDIVSIRAARGRHLVPTEANRYRISATNWPGTPSTSFPDRDVAGAHNWPDPCRSDCSGSDSAPVLFDSGGGDVPPVTRLRITDTQGHTVNYNVRTPNTCLVGRPRAGGTPCAVGLADDTAYYNLPDNQGALCITDCHGHRTVKLRIRRYTGPGGPPGTAPASQRAGWVVHDDGPFDAVELNLPPQPRISIERSHLNVIPPRDHGRPGLSLALHFDRPVQVRVTPRVFQPTADYCHSPPVQTTENTEKDPQFTFHGLCYGTAYGFAVRATDANTGGVLSLNSFVFNQATSQLTVPLLRVDMSATSTFRHRTSGFRLRATAPQVEMSPNPDRAPREQPGCADGSQAIRNQFELVYSGIGDGIVIDFDTDLAPCQDRIRLFSISKVFQLQDLADGPVTYTATQDGVTLTAVVSLPHGTPPLAPVG